MCLPATMLPTTRISKDGYGLSFSASEGPPWIMSAHVIVLAGICTIMLHGTTIWMPLIVTVPPRRLAWETSGQALLSALTVASWMKPVSSKPWMSIGAVVNPGSGSVGVMNGDTAPAGGFGGPPPPLGWGRPAPALGVGDARPADHERHAQQRGQAQASPSPSSAHPSVHRSRSPTRSVGLKTFVAARERRKAASCSAACGAEQRTPATEAPCRPARAPRGPAPPGAERRKGSAGGRGAAGAAPRRRADSGSRRAGPDGGRITNVAAS